MQPVFFFREWSDAPGCGARLRVREQDLAAQLAHAVDLGVPRDGRCE